MEPEPGMGGAGVVLTQIGSSSSLESHFQPSKKERKKRKKEHIGSLTYKKKREIKTRRLQGKE